LLEDAQEAGRVKLRPELELIRQLASEMLSQTNETLDAASIEAGRADLPALQTKLQHSAARIVATANTLSRKAKKLKDDSFQRDLWRIATAARQTQALARNGIATLAQPDGVAQVSLPSSPSAVETKPGESTD